MSVFADKRGPVTTVILDRPEVRNAVDRPTAEALAEAFRAFEADEAARVAVLWGAGGTFCAGADLKAVALGRGNRVDPDGDGPMGPSRMRLAKPVIAAVSGFAVAGGFELALWCDLRVAEEDATFGFFERRWGVPLIDGGTVRLPRLIGLSRALDLILTGRALSAVEAQAWGIANRVVPHGQARVRAEELAAEIAAFPQVCMRGDRRSALDGMELDHDAAMARELELGMGALEAESLAGATLFSWGKGAMENLTELLRAARRILIFSGAGISTGSGIPDFRGPNGVWTKRQPVYYDQFLASEEKRVEYWDGKLEAWEAFSLARPNATHAAVVELERRARLLSVVTQNIDGLHQAAGSSSELVVEVHGTNRFVECVKCDKRSHPPLYLDEFRRTRAAPRCECGGWLKFATISFGQPLDPRVTRRAFTAAAECDLVVALGSTLSVQPACLVPLEAARRGVPYVVINRGATDHDQLCTLRLEGDVAEILPLAVASL